jgi:hypothetical protein
MLLLEEMIVFIQNYQIYCYIHIPKNSGTYFGKKIEENAECTVIKKLW